MTIIKNNGYQLPEGSVYQPATTTNGAVSGSQTSGKGKVQDRERHSVMSSNETNSDRKSDQKLRPQHLKEYIGQSHLKMMLTMSISAALERKEPIDHVLLYGPPGLGKTTLAQVIASEMGAKIHMTSGPSLERPRDIVGLVHQLEAGDVLFIDEIHRLNRVAEELLYPAIEDFMIDLTSGKGHATRTMRLPLPKFTLIGATTKAGSISKALRDRFGFSCRLDFYNQEELSKIVERTGGILGLTIEQNAVDQIASRSRGTPRIANRLVRLVRDFAQYKGKKEIDREIAVEALQSYQVDQSGLDSTDRKLLHVVINNYDGGPVGIDTIAATIGEDSETIEDVYEPFLIQAGFLQRTPRGRIATALAYKHLGKNPPANQLSLDFGRAENQNDSFAENDEKP